MKKCLTPEERKEKQVAIKYLYRELYERLECLDYKPDSLCNAYLAIIESMQSQIIETSTRLKSRDSRTCKQAHLKSNSSFTVAGEPLQI